MSSTVSGFKPRHLVSMLELEKNELINLIDRAQYFKNLIKSNQLPPNNLDQALKGKTSALLFTKRSTRTRISSEGAVVYFGGHPFFLNQNDIQLGVNESLLDTVKVLSSMTSCIFARVNSHNDIQELCKYSSVPVINSLCDTFHPLQSIADLLTIKEQFSDLYDPVEKSFKGKLKLTWIGDANNVINDLSIACLKFGINVSVVLPKNIQFNNDIYLKGKEISKENNVKFEILNDPVIGCLNSNILVTDTFVSMGEEDSKLEKLKKFENLQINSNLVKSSKVNSNWIFMHCLPRHKEEVSDEVFYSDNSVVFQEAENRLYAAISAIEGFVINKGKLV
ncbi:ornithine carbamoyltransferase [Ascoidea rubescens DSM 1968]|uniref:ornithine carbamoyltransferase n=1 Tax=Ascoidea rubescens DSM 1968 TaxID=1344418 RepID=A0A1D2VEQ1_9ASCO|nr:ornithine carbamoyltransferase OTC/ARG3 [Ascoidea rubescens DSM 1968]ODV59947.1 ornithine carbamoyltransferase OTC/ARG3 [Ascoidea rubescens DSM 1968]